MKLRKSLGCQLWPTWKGKDWARHYDQHKAEKFDSKITETAKHFGGILSLSVIVHELRISLDVAQASLERFVSRGEAHKRTIGKNTIYDFKNAREQLAVNQNKIINKLLDNYKGLTRAQLIALTGIKLGSLEKSLKRLESDGKVIYNKNNDKYTLRGIED